MTNQQYISIAKLLEQNKPDLFEQYKSDLNNQIDVELLFIDFCEAIGCFPVNIVGKPYDREASKNKALFVAAVIRELKTEKIPRGIKKQLSTVLKVPAQRMCSFVQNVTLFLYIYPDFQNEVNEICTKIHENNEKVQIECFTG